MTLAVFYKLLAIFLTVGAGLGRRPHALARRAHGRQRPGARARQRRLLHLRAGAAVPHHGAAGLRDAALAHGGGLLRAGAAVRASWSTCGSARRAPSPVAAPAVRAISASFGNSVQLGIPMAAALFGEAGLAIHIALVSLHALILLTMLTVLVETRPGARADTAARPSVPRCARRCATPCCTRWCCRCWPVWPGTSPAWACTRWSTRRWPASGSAVVPVCLVLIGLSLAYYGVQGPGARRGGDLGAQAAGAAGAGAGDGALGLRPVRPAAGGGGADGGAADRQQRADLRAALRRAADRGHRGDRVLDGGLRGSPRRCGWRCWRCSAECRRRSGTIGVMQIDDLAAYMAHMGAAARAASTRHGRRADGGQGPRAARAGAAACAPPGSRCRRPTRIDLDAAAARRPGRADGRPAAPDATASSTPWPRAASRSPRCPTRWARSPASSAARAASASARCACRWACSA